MNHCGTAYYLALAYICHLFHNVICDNMLSVAYIKKQIDIGFYVASLQKSPFCALELKDLLDFCDCAPSGVH